MNINKDYWENLYESGHTSWDIGYVSTPIKEYIDQLTNKNIRILIPGAGIGYEVDYLFKKGFQNTFYLDYSKRAINYFKKNCPDFPKSNIINRDFFSINEKYDLIIESAFFTSIIPENREKLATKIYDLLNPKGKYVGVFFNHDFGNEHPPFGAVKETYMELVKELFKIKTFDTAYNSIKPRAGRELFFIFEKD